MTLDDALRAQLSAAWQLDDVILPVSVLEALETGREFYVEEVFQAAEAMGVKLSDLARAADD